MCNVKDARVQECKVHKACTLAFLISKKRIFRGKSINPKSIQTWLIDLITLLIIYLIIYLITDLITGDTDRHYKRVCAILGTVVVHEGYGSCPRRVRHLSMKGTAVVHEGYGSCPWRVRLKRAIRTFKSNIEDFSIKNNEKILKNRKK